MSMQSSVIFFLMMMMGEKRGALKLPDGTHTSRRSSGGALQAISLHHSLLFTAFPLLDVPYSVLPAQQTMIVDRRGSYRRIIDSRGERKKTRAIEVRRYRGHTRIC